MSGRRLLPRAGAVGAACASLALAACGGAALSGPTAGSGTPVPSPVATAPPAPEAPWRGGAPVFFAGEAQGIGDPNPFFHHGRYHVFYLQNEGRHPWRMASSADLSQWTEPVDAVPVGRPGEPDHWTGSGSVIADPAGGFRIYYTGHLPNGDPKEVVMSSRADAPGGPWRKVATPRFDGSPGYDRFDFRDPFVFWNDEARAWWMLLTTRAGGRAAIGLYTSADAVHWDAAPPLYTEASPLNLEVPDLFREGPDWYLLQSDQRDAFRQTRYLRAPTSAGPYAYGPFDALDGRGFYAGKTAGTGAARMLFGWVAHRRGRTDAGGWDWGGDLVAHAVRRTAEGALAVDIAPSVADRFARPVARLALAGGDGATIDAATRIVADVAVGGDRSFGIRFARAGQPDAVLRIDPAAGEARFRRDGGPDDGPVVAVPRRADGRYRIDLLLDPARGFGILYLDRFRALSFRYYALGGTAARPWSDDPAATVDGQVLRR